MTRWASACAMVVAAGCYSPHVSPGIPCADGTGSDRCPAGETCVSVGGQDLCEPAGFTTGGDAGTSGSDSAPMSDWWNPAWGHRAPLDITAGDNGAPGGYTIAVAFDHASLVAAGEALASGDDVRVVSDGGTDIDRVLDTGASWDTATTIVWFQVSEQLAEGQTVRYWLYYGNASAGSPPAHASNVFLLADDFEGDLDAWSTDTGVVTSTLQAHGGSRSVMVPAQDDTGNGLGANNIDRDNIVFDMWWFFADTTNLDCSEFVRGNDNTLYFTDLQPPSAGDPSIWDISKAVNGTYSEVVPPPNGASSPSDNTWVRITVYAYGKTMAVDVGGTPYVPTSGFADVKFDTHGSVGGFVYFSNAPVWMDDARLRLLVVPEPVLVMGPDQPYPGS
ncbi:MAG TPA: DUF2341 domain-containing protein [Kofleriaceae bacterium]|nr:DUF2341 domain-containing protein [Kofleriaceae bacterium]